MSNLPASRRLLLSATLLLAGLACQPPASRPEQAPVFLPGIALRPLAATLAPGAVQVFQAEVNYPEGLMPLRQPVSWAVVEPGGGSVTAHGIYTAPRTPGTYRVRAWREDYPQLSATATVTVK